ncbi:hypothetical protein ACF06X_33695 [Streptomyces sp. NPDC015346]|uniref:hypothetical protein n=1 Tax=Streptomyces sp. NPDC015346 TaxID=3364954 RepID=UPI0036FC4598
MADTFPQDLIDAQLRLHQVRAEYEAYCQTLPWSVEPDPGWAGREPSPGYTDKQKTEVARLQALLGELTDTVTRHPHWETIERGPALIEARMKLKHHPGAVPAVVAAT